MIVDTKEISSRVKLGSMLVILILVVLVVLDLIPDVHRILFSWAKNHIIEYSALIAFLVFEAFLFSKKFNYIYYNSDGFKIILKYTSLAMLNSGNFKLEIPKKDFVDAEVKKSWFGLRKSLIIYVKSPQGIAKFKPISITILKSRELEDILTDLNTFKN